MMFYCYCNKHVLYKSLYIYQVLSHVRDWMGDVSQLLSEELQPGWELLSLGVKKEWEGETKRGNHVTHCKNYKHWDLTVKGAYTHK